jgi:hypothetical protein
MDMTWNQIEVCLNIKELAQYKDFILSCPGINKKIRLNINRGAFEFGMNKVIKKEYTPTQESQDEEDHNTTVESNTELILTDQSSDFSTDSNVKNKESDYDGTTLCVTDNDFFLFVHYYESYFPYGECLFNNIHKMSMHECTKNGFNKA